MKGTIIITAYTPEDLIAGKKSTEDLASGAEFSLSIKDVSGFDKITLVNGLADALKFTEMDWMMLLGLKLRLGPFSDKYRRDIHVTIPKVQKEDSANE